MLHEDVVISPEVVLVPPLVAVDVVINHTSQRTNSLPASCVVEPTTQCSSATKGLIPPYMGEDKSANAARSYGVNSNWYADLDATDHITRELDKLAVKDSYNDAYQIYIASGSGTHIKHVGQSIIHTPYRDLTLNHVLHVPQDSKNLASIHRITSDNNIFFEIHPNFFFYQGSGVEENTPSR
jgi:hypothetical protein